MKKFNLEIDDQVFKCSVAKTDDERKKGYSGDDAPAPDECMLFVFPGKGKNQMWMKNTKVPLDIVFMDEDLKVLEIITSEPDSSEMLGSSKNVSYVIEFAAGTTKEADIQVGDQLEDIPEEHLKPSEDNYVMDVLDEDGNVQMRIRGGERIFSRKSTKEIVKKSLNATSDAQIKELATTVLKEILAQDTRDAEYVEGPTKESYKLEE